MQNPPSIEIYSGSHLCHNPRVIKEATTLADAGYRVEVIGGWFDHDLKSRDEDLLSRLRLKFTPIMDLVVNNDRRRFAARLGRKLGEIVQVKAGWENTRQLGIFMPALRKRAVQSSADLLIAHSESTMAAVAAAGRKRQCRVGVDMEDWFSEDGTTVARARRPLRLLRSLEQTLLNLGSHTSCPSRAMSESLAGEFGCKPPHVIYNAFEFSERLKLDGKLKDRRNSSVPSIHWYSQTLGLGRGLETLFAALPLVKHNVEIHLRGKQAANFEKWLVDHVPPAWRDRIFLHDVVTNDELLSRIAEHDIGFAGEMKYSRSRDLTITNKVLQYLLAGLAVVASDTAGQREVAERATGALSLYRADDPQSLAAQLDILLVSPKKIATAKRAAVAAAEKTFCWERQAPVLLQSVTRALAERI